MTRKSSGLGRNTLNLVFGQICTTALTIVLSAAVARTLGAADFGVLFLVTAVATFAYVFVDWGHGQYVIREVARHPERVGELMGSVLAVRAATVVALIPPALLVGYVLGYDARIEAAILVMMLAWMPMYLGLCYGWAFRGIERMEYDALVNVVLKFLWLVAGVAILALGGRLFGVIVASGIAGVATLIVGHVVYRRLGLAPLRVSRETARELIVGGAPMVTMTIAVAIQIYLNAVLLSWMTSKEVLGWYGAASTFTNTLIAPAAVLSSAAYPRLSVVAGDRAQFTRLLREAMRVLLFVAVLGGVGTYLFADVAVGVVYSAAKFGPSADILRAFAPAMVLIFVDMMLAIAVLAAGSAMSLAGVKVISLASALIAQVILIPIFQTRFGNGGIGVVLSFAVGEFVMIAAGLRLLPEGTLTRSIVTDPLRALAAGAGTLVVGGTLSQLSPFIGIPACVATFSLLAFAVGLLTRADIAALVSLVTRRRRSYSEVAPALTS